jgi:hypothetical protein
MGVFLKLACLGAAIGGGSLLMAWLLSGGHVALAWLALAATAALTVGVIVAIARETRLTDQVQR